MYFNIFLMFFSTFSHLLEYYTIIAEMQNTGLKFYKTFTSSLRRCTPNPVAPALK